MARLTGLEPATPGVTGRYSNQLSYNRASFHPFLMAVARLTGLEPATPGVTGRYSNQLSYNRVSAIRNIECSCLLWSLLGLVKRVRDKKLTARMKYLCIRIHCRIGHFSLAITRPAPMLP
jgi:hypothetical protein